MGSLIPVGGGAGGAFQVTATADGAITAGDAVERSASGTARKKLGNYPLYMTEALFDESAAVRFYEVTEFDMTLAVGYSPHADQGNSSQIRLVLMNHAWEPITSHDFSPGVTGVGSFDVAWNPATSSGVVGYAKSSNYYHMHFHISAADTISASTPSSAISIGGSTSPAIVACAHVAADKAVFAVGNSWTHTQELRCVCIQFDDTGITSTGAWISAGAGIGTGAYAIAGDTTNGQVGVICYGLNSSSSRRQYINVLTVSGVTLTAGGSPVTLVAAETYVGGVGMAYHAADDLWYMVTYNNSTAKTVCHILQESGGGFSISGSLTDDTISLGGGEATVRVLLYNTVNSTVYAVANNSVYSLPSPGAAGTTSLTLVGAIPTSTDYGGDGSGSAYPSTGIGDRWWSLFVDYGNLHVGSLPNRDTIKGPLGFCIDLANAEVRGDGQFAGVADADAADAATVTINSGYLDATWVTFTAGDLLSVGGDNLPAVTTDSTRIHGVAISAASSLVLTVDGAGLLKSEE